MPVSIPESPLLGSTHVPSRRRRRVVLYALVVGGVFIALHTSLSASASPSNPESSASRYVNRVESIKQQGIAAIRGSAGWWGAGSDPYDAQEFLSDEHDPLFGISDQDPEMHEQWRQKIKESTKAGTDLEEAWEEMEAEVTEPPGASTHKLPEMKYDWPGAWEQEHKEEEHHHEEQEHTPDDNHEEHEEEQHSSKETEEQKHEEEEQKEEDKPEPPKEIDENEFDFSITVPDDLPEHTPSPDQPRIVILQHVFPSDTVSRRLFALSQTAYKAYAKYWGYTYRRDSGIYMPSEFEARRKGMNKLYPVLEVMIDELGKKGGAEWMLMTDADTLPINPSIPLHNLLPPRDSPVWFMGNEDWNGFNAGNMLIRISRETVAFLSEVIAREVDMSRYDGTGKYASPPPSDQEALCLEVSSDEWREHFYSIPMKWINAYCSPYERGQDDGGPVTLPWTDGGEQQPGIWTPQLNFHLVFILKHYRDPQSLLEQMDNVWKRMASDQGWRTETGAKAAFAGGKWWDEKKEEGGEWKKGASPKCMGF